MSDSKLIIQVYPYINNNMITKQQVIVNSTKASLETPETRLRYIFVKQ